MIIALYVKWQWLTWRTAKQNIPKVAAFVLQIASFQEYVKSETSEESVTGLLGVICQWIYHDVTTIIANAFFVPWIANVQCRWFAIVLCSCLQVDHWTIYERVLTWAKPKILDRTALEMKQRTLDCRQVPQKLEELGARDRLFPFPSKERHFVFRHR